MAASFQTQEQGVNHQISMPNVLTPELLLTDIQQAESLKKKDPKRYERLMQAHPQVFEFRTVEKVTFLQSRNEIPLSHIWMKTKEKLKASLLLQQQLLAFASDYNLLLTATLPHREELIKSKVLYGYLWR